VIALAYAALALAGCPGVNPNPPIWGVGEDPAAETLDGNVADGGSDAP
jgi:hypothetical protein